MYKHDNTPELALRLQTYAASLGVVRTVVTALLRSLVRPVSPAVQRRNLAMLRKATTTQATAALELYTDVASHWCDAARDRLVTHSARAISRVNGRRKFVEAFRLVIEDYLGFVFVDENAPDGETVGYGGARAWALIHEDADLTKHRSDALRVLLDGIKHLGRSTAAKQHCHLEYARTRDVHLLLASLWDVCSTQWEPDRDCRVAISVAATFIGKLTTLMRNNIADLGVRLELLHELDALFGDL